MSSAEEQDANDDIEQNNTSFFPCLGLPAGFLRRRAGGPVRRIHGLQGQGAAPGTVSRACSTTRAMSKNPIFPARKRATAASLAPFRMAGAVPPCRRRANGQGQAAEGLQVRLGKGQMPGSETDPADRQGRAPGPAR